MRALPDRVLTDKTQGRKCCLLYSRYIKTGS